MLATLSRIYGTSAPVLLAACNPVALNKFRRQNGFYSKQLVVLNISDIISLTGLN
ncbi:hypothetical protein J6590_062605 [Homalodisca vitripennis]|nr:hypothetical protein J6590_062605 [Homalodisca vitripennis]